MSDREVIEPLKEPVSIEKALLGGRAVKVSTSSEGSSAAFLVNIQLTGWNNTKEYNEGYASGFNNAAEWMQKAIASHTRRIEQSARATPADHISQARDAVPQEIEDISDGTWADLHKTQAEKALSEVREILTDSGLSHLAVRVCRALEKIDLILPAPPEKPAGDVSDI